MQRHFVKAAGAGRVRQSFASAIIHALPLPPRHKDTKYTKRASKKACPSDLSNVPTWTLAFFTFATDFHGKLGFGKQ